jgi:tetratricopeptide (TPR) repeat protein
MKNVEENISTITQPTLQKDIAGYWRLYYPEIVEEYHEEFYQALEIMDYEPKKAEKIFRKIINACGNGHIDAILHLGFLFNDTGRGIEGSALIYKAHMIALESFRVDFNAKKDKINWSILENRPLLRTFHAIGLEYINERNYEDAVKKFEFILDVNPGDNQGVRFLIPECLMLLEKYEQFLQLDNKSEDRDSIEYSFARVLSHFKLQQFDKAKVEFNDAKKKHPFVAEELAKDKHAFPKDEFEHMPVQPFGIPTRSRQEAFTYWARTKRVWEARPEFKEFIHSNM